MNSKAKFKKILRQILVVGKKKLRKMKARHIVLLVLLISLGVFNATTALSPQMKQAKREKNIERIFNQWWEEERKGQFILVGLTPTDKIKQEEFDQYRERYLKQNDSYIVEEQIARLRPDFREWWENKGGKQEFEKKNGRYPKERDFENEFRIWSYNISDKDIRYKLAFVPIRENIECIMSSLILSPGVISFLIFLVYFFFAYNKLQRRFGAIVTLLFFFGAAFAGGFMVLGLTETSFFYHYTASRYMGQSIPLAFLLGCASFSNRNDISSKVRQISISGVILNALADAFLYQGIFLTTAIAAPVFFGLGCVTGLKMPTRKLSQREQFADSLEERIERNTSRNLMAELKATTRKLFEEACDKGQKGFYEAGQQMLCKSMTYLLQERPFDMPMLKEILGKMEDPAMFFEVPSIQWFEWGGAAKRNGIPEAAIILLEKGLPLEKNETTARRALYSIGEMRLANKIGWAKGLEQLNKVIKIRNDDILASQAQRLLDKAAAQQEKAATESAFRRRN